MYPYLHKLHYKWSYCRAQLQGAFTVLDYDINRYINTQFPAQLTIEVEII